jgi:hypothetical protein
MDANIINYMGVDITLVPTRLITEELNNFAKIISKKIKVVIVTIPTTKLDNHYPILKDEDKTYTYIYLYFIIQTAECKLCPSFHFGEKPKHFLTFSHMQQKNVMINKINQLRKELEEKTNFGVIKCTKKVNDIPEGDKIIDLLTSDQQITFGNYLLALVGTKEHYIDFVLSIQDREERKRKLEAYIYNTVRNMDVESRKKLLLYTNVYDIQDSTIRELVFLYNYLIKY